jgi:hypothetical protein
MIAYRIASGAVFMVLGLLIFAQMLLFAVHDGARILVGVVLGLAMIAFGGHRILLATRARKPQ